MHARDQQGPIRRHPGNNASHQRHREYQDSEEWLTSRLPPYGVGHCSTAWRSSQSLPSGAMRCPVNKLPVAGSDKAANTRVLSAPNSVL